MLIFCPFTRPDKNAKRDIAHGVKHLEEIAEGWLCARRTLGVLSALAKKWKVELPEEALTVLERTDVKFGLYSADSPPSNVQRRPSEKTMSPSLFAAEQYWQNQASGSNTASYFSSPAVSNVNAGAAQGMPSQSPNSDTYRLPSQDALASHLRHSSSASIAPRNSLQQVIDARNVPSPSDMFTGFEPSMRDGQDFLYRDGQQVATGFENWNGVDMDLTSLWTNSMFGTPGTGAASNGMSIPTAQAPTYGMTGNTPMGGYPVTNWGTAVNPYDQLATYNESEWYQ